MRVALGVLAVISGAAATLYKATDYYSDASCSTGVNQFFLSPQSSCPTTESCRVDGSNGYPRSSISCVSNAVAHAQTIFGNDPYLLVPDFRADTTCTKEFNVYGVRLLKGQCLRTGPTSSIKYSVRIDWAVDALTYTTSDCSGKPDNVTRRSSSDINTNKCIRGTKMLVVQAPYQTPVIYTAYTYFSDSSCLTANRLLFTPVKVESIADDADYTTCEQDANGLYYSRDPFIDGIVAYSGGALGYDVAYMIEEGFYDSSCSLDHSVSVYRSDGTCINMGTYSEKHTILNGVYSVVQYTGVTCSGTGTTTLSLASTYWNNGACSSFRKFRTYQTPTPAPTVTTTKPPTTTKPATTTKAPTTTKPATTKKPVKLPKPPKVL